MFSIGSFSVLTKFRLNFTTKRKEVEIKCCFPLTSPVCNSFGAFSAEPMCSCSIQASSSTTRRRKEGGISLPLAYRPVHLMSFGAIFLRTSKFLLITLLAFISLLKRSCLCESCCLLQVDGVQPGKGYQQLVHSKFKTTLDLQVFTEDDKCLFSYKFEVTSRRTIFIFFCI